MPSGRPKFPIDPSRVRSLARMGLFTTEIAGLLGCDEGVIRKRFKKEVGHGRALRKLDIRRWQNNAMKKGAQAMLIFIGKNELHQTDVPAFPENDVKIIRIPKIDRSNANRGN